MLSLRDSAVGCALEDCVFHGWAVFSPVQHTALLPGKGLNVVGLQTMLTRIQRLSRTAVLQIGQTTRSFRWTHGLWRDAISRSLGKPLKY
jgi:hypothetical protein